MVSSTDCRECQNQGDAPDIVKDDITKVTLFDYSDIVAGAKPASAEKQN